MSEQHLAIILIAGLVIAGGGLLWLLIRAFRARFWWGLGLILFPPLTIWFVVRHWPKFARPTLVVLLGVIVAAAPYAYSQIANWLVDFGPYEKIVDGERHLTLTGWDREDYALIRARSNVVVLQMANEDVADETLDHVRDLKQLREVDLNHTQVTDVGLEKLKALPSLRTLRLRKTQITDEGFRTHLLPLADLMELDVRETGVRSATMREWRRGGQGRRGFP